jgi:hypothetical protein
MSKGVEVTLLLHGTTIRKFKGPDTSYEDMLFPLYNAKLNVALNVSGKLQASLLGFEVELSSFIS